MLFCQRLLIFGCSCAVILSQASVEATAQDADLWGPNYHSLVRLPVTPDIKDFTEIDSNKINEALRLCYEALKDSKFESDRELVTQALVTPIRPLTDAFLKQEGGGEVTTAAGSVDFAKGHLLLRCEEHKHPFDLALTILHEMGHLLRKENPLERGTRDLEWYYARSSFEALAYSQERRHAQYFYDWIERNGENVPGKDTWQRFLKQSIYEARSAELTYTVAKSFLYLSYLADMHCQRLEREHASFKGSPEWKEFQGIRERTFGIGKEDNLTATFKYFRELPLLFDKMQRVFAEDTPIELLERLESMSELVTDCERFFAFAKARHISDGVDLHFIPIEDLADL